MVLPSMRRARPLKLVMATLYCPPVPSQCPSRCCALAIHSSPLAIAGRYSTGISSATNRSLPVNTMLPATSHHENLMSSCSLQGPRRRSFLWRVHKSPTNVHAHSDSVVNQPGTSNIVGQVCNLSLGTKRGMLETC